jgi:hypothetical protein
MVPLGTFPLVRGCLWSGAGSNRRPSAFQKVCRSRCHQVGVDQSAQLKRIRPGSWADVLILAVVPTCAGECRFARVIRVLDPPGPGLVLLLCWRKIPDSQGNPPRSRLTLVSAGWRFLPQRGALADLSAPIALQSTLVTLKARLRTATRNACSASQSHAERRLCTGDDRD